MVLFLVRSLLLLRCAAPTNEENCSSGGVANYSQADMEHGRRKLDKGAAAAGGGHKVEIAHYPKF